MPLCLFSTVKMPVTDCTLNVFDEIEEILCLNGLLPKLLSGNYMATGQFRKYSAACLETTSHKTLG